MAIKTRHTELRAEMVRHGMDGTALGNAIGCSRITASQKLCGHVPFNTREMYTLLDLFQRPDSDIGILFPRDGIAEGQECYRKLPTDLPRAKRRIAAI